MKTILSLLLLTALLPLCAEDLDPRLAPMADTYSKQVKAITDRSVTAKSKALESFLAELKESEAKATKGGNVKELAAIKKEIADLEKGLALPVPPLDLPKLMESRHKTYVKAFENADAAAARDKKQLDEKYLAALAKLQPASSDAALAAQIEDQKKRVLSGNLGPMTDLQTQLAGTRWQMVKDPSKFEVFTKEGRYVHWKYTTPDPQTVIIHWDAKSSEAWKLAKDGKTLLRNGQPDMMLAPAAPK
ncbi:MAG: hypothetical protein EOP88_09535 [Verrucomicrobiaceae bacterium]|nr:MAG: hypothetical protein EOP88_09535 [Verrucomicrobiaceae bacterium]